MHMKASIIATNILQTQRESTGFAILGKPPVEVLVDQKIKGSTYTESKLVGEHLAHNALTSEIFVLRVAGVPEKEHRHYI